MKEVWRDLPDAETIIAETRAELKRLDEHELGRGTIALGRAGMALERGQEELQKLRAGIEWLQEQVEKLGMVVLEKSFQANGVDICEPGPDGGGATIVGGATLEEALNDVVGLAAKDEEG